MGGHPTRLELYPIMDLRATNRPNGNAIQSPPERVHLLVRAPFGSGYGHTGSGSEPLECGLRRNSTQDAGGSAESFTGISWSSCGCGATSPSGPSQCLTSPTLQGNIDPRSTPQTEGDGPVHIRPRSQIETMDRLSFMATFWKKRLDLNVTAFLKVLVGA